MNAIRRWSSPLLIALPIFCLSAGPTSRGAPLSGPASGVWQLPEFTVADGFVLGSLDSVDGGASIYAFQATLTDSGAACPACIVGEIHGSLDDGLGPAPDYLVDGAFFGIYPGGTGSFRARVKRPDGTLVGWIRGRFEDPPGSPDTGSFLGHFRIRG